MSDLRTFVGSYVQRCDLDPELKRHDDTVRTNVEHVVQSIGDGNGVVPTLKSFVTAVRDIDQSVTNNISEIPLEELEWVAGDEQRTIFVNYLDLSSDMLSFCNELDNFVYSARRCHEYITYEIQQLEEKDVDVDKNKSRFIGIVEKLTKLKSSKVVDGISVDGLLEKLKSLTDRHAKLLTALSKHHTEYMKSLEEKIQGQKNWIRIFDMIAIASVAAISMIAIVATLGAMALATAAVVPTAVAAIWGTAAVVSAVDAGYIIWQTHENGKILSELEKQRETFEKWTKLLKVPANTYTTELGTIKSDIERLANSIKSLVEDAVFAVEEESDMSFATKEIKEHLEIFQQKVEDLDSEAKKLREHILENREKVKKKMNA